MSRKSIFSTLFVVSIISLSVTSCVQSPSDEINSQQNTSIGTDGELINIQSDNVMAAGYDDKSAVMTVQFKNGALYEYYGVSAGVWQSFVAAQPHPWSQVGNPKLVQSGIPYKRVG